MFLNFFSALASFSCSFSYLYSCSFSCSCSGSYSSPFSSCHSCCKAPPSCQSFNISWARIHKPRNRLPAWQAGTTTLYEAPARQATWAIGISSWAPKTFTNTGSEVTVHGNHCSYMYSCLRWAAASWLPVSALVCLLSIPLLQSQIKYGRRKKKRKKGRLHLKMRQVIFFGRLLSSILQRSEDLEMLNWSWFFLFFVQKNLISRIFFTSALALTMQRWMRTS